MRLVRSILPPLAAAALSGAAIRPAAAQRITADPVRATVARAGATPDTVARRTLAVYRFGISPLPDMPSVVTLADSAGELVATFRRAGTRDLAPMVVDVLGPDITLHGATPSGVLTLVLYGQNDPQTVNELAGRWVLGDRQGVLRGRAER